MSTLSDNGARNGSFVFQLFVAGDESNSSEARENLKTICESYLKERYKIQIVDVFKSFDIALENRIFLTPALVRVSPSPKITVFGNLSDTGAVLKALGIGLKA
ncbi:MAG: circadian clock KaiB family protein [Desulfobacterales bacterium]